ncbi:MAG: pantetheine-phosphate adenylyltransferase [Candidatus Kapabacteria bacterium]|nr:pantetheine-phosphate adenylyltransferase [Candidatus Kapabacteria bacterium]
MKSTAIFPGSFDPVTLGHVDILKRSCRLFSEIILLIGNNITKNTMFSLNDRMEMCREAVASVKTSCKISVESFQGLTTDFARKCGAGAIIRGVRTFADFEYEMQIAAVNRRLNPEVETIFLACGDEFACVSSSAVRELAKFGADLSGYVPECVIKKVKNL